MGVATGSEIAIVDEQGKFLSAGRQGEILIRGANITQGYENNPEANKEAFTDGWFRTGDQGYLDEDGYLFITGRLKEIINRGGEKISPREVDDVLIDHPAVAQVVTFAVPHPTLGEDVASAIVLHESASATEREILEFAAKRLADFKVPRQIFIVDEIPKGPTGKLRRVGLAEKLSMTSPDHPQTLPKAESAAYRTPLEKALAEIGPRYCTWSGWARTTIFSIWVEIRYWPLWSFLGCAEFCSWSCPWSASLKNPPWRRWP